jgi:tetratricopeptide (TPR) repeat protein
MLSGDVLARRVKYLDLNLDIIMNSLEIAKAKDLHAQGKAEELYHFIKKYLDKNDPYAIYFYSTISLADWNESYDQQESRRIKLLIESADGDVPEAAYQLACCYLAGDGVEMSWDRAVEYIKKAMEKQYEPAIVMHAQLQKNQSNFG